MAETVSAHCDEDHIETLQAMKRDGRADSISEALRQTSELGLERRGYRNGASNETGLRRAAQEFSRAFLWIGVGWMALTLLLPIEYRLGAFAAFAAAGACAAIDRFLEHREPNISRRLGLLPGAVDGGERA